MCGTAFSAMRRNKLAGFCKKLPLAGSIALMVASTAPSSTIAEQKQQQPTSNSNKQICKALYNAYDSNMEVYYNKKNSNADRQAAYRGAQIALADFRKQGCKLKDIR
ncbi:hypothetical protein [Aestuariivirga sp.]|uniref:hypothetical protein n=1 Tax=Aestuariivirga sp. TaxID=2650926 RepID=UPI00391920DC